MQLKVGNRLSAENPIRLTSSDTDVGSRSLDSVKGNEAGSTNDILGKTRTTSVKQQSYVNVDVEPVSDLPANKSETEGPGKVARREKKLSEKDQDVDASKIRTSLLVGRKKILSMFKEKSLRPATKPPSKPPRNSLKISSPVVSSVDTAMLPMSSEYMIPIKEDNKSPTGTTENPYAEVRYDDDEFTDDSQDDESMGSPYKARRPYMEIMVGGVETRIFPKHNSLFFRFFICA